MARRKVEAKLIEINNTLISYRNELKNAELDFEDAESRVLYYQDQIRRLKDAKTSMNKIKLKC